MKDTMRLPKQLAALAAALALVLTPASAAGADGRDADRTQVTGLGGTGPEGTSVLLVSHGSAEAAALHAFDKRFEELYELADVSVDSGQREQPSSLDMELRPRVVSLSRMAHEESVSRTDRLIWDRKSAGVWIHSIWQVSSDGAGARPGFWHRAAEPARLTELVKGLGVLGKPPARRGITGYGPVREPRPGPAAATPAGSREPSGVTGARAPQGRDTAVGRWWSVPGPAVGVGATLMVLRRPAVRHGRPGA
jgi:hypothetical protein